MILIRVGPISDLLVNFSILYDNCCLALVRCKMKFICTNCDCLRKISACMIKFQIRVSNLALKLVDY